MFTEDDDGVWFSRTELNGVPDDKLTTMEVAGGEDSMLKFTFRNGHFGDVMRHALSGETRKKFYVAKQHRFPENAEILSRMVILRDEIAWLLGYVRESCCAEDGREYGEEFDVEESLHEIRRRLEPASRAESERLLLLKRRDIESRQEAETTNDLEVVSKLYIWDWGYYSRLRREESYFVDNAKLTEYFEVMHTVKGMLGVFKKVFRLEFEQIEASVWHEHVKVYSVWGSESEGGGFLGYRHLDLFARQGKYRGGHSIIIRSVSPLFTPRKWLSRAVH